MSPFRGLLLGDMRVGDTLRGKCRRCDHVGPVGLIDILYRHGPNVKVSAICKAAYCQQCDSRDIEWTRVTSGVGQKMRNLKLTSPFESARDRDIRMNYGIRSKR